MFALRVLAKGVIGVLLFGMLCLPASAGDSEKNGQRYASYRFLPEYADPSLTDEIKKRITPNLKFDEYDFWEVREAKGVMAGGKLFAAFEVNIKDGQMGDFSRARYAIERNGGYFPKGGYQAVGVWVNEDDLNIHEEKSQLYSSFHYGWDFYGCIEDDWIFKAKLFEGKPEAVFSVTGVGDKTSNLMLDRITLTAYAGSGGQRMFEKHLLLTNYWIPTEGDLENQTKYAFPSVTEKPEESTFPAAGNAGLKQYAKVFFADFNQNDRLDMMVWYRKYRSEKLTESENPGFVFEEERFEHLEENATSTGFDIKDIEPEQAYAWLAENNLRWKDGYPSENRCRGKNANLADIPMMVRVKDPDIE